MSEFAYYYGSDGEQFNFFRLPKKLIRDKAFSALSSEAKILYGVMLDRMSLSIQNRWLDEEDRVYIIFTVKEVMEEFQCSERKAIKLMAELDSKSGIGLIEKRRQGLGKPNILYVKNFNSLTETVREDVPALSEEEEGTYSEDGKEAVPDSGTDGDFQKDVKNPEGEVRHFQTCRNVQVKTCRNVQVKTCKNVQVKTCKDVQVKNKTDKNETNNINIYNPSIHPDMGLHTDGWKDWDWIWKFFQERLGYSALIHDNPYRRGQIDELFRLITDACCQQDQSVQNINGSQIRTMELRKRFLKLNPSHIRYVLHALDQNQTEVRNIRSYLLTCLYNAPVTISNYYAQMVQSDWGKDASSRGVMSLQAAKADSKSG